MLSRLVPGLRAWLCHRALPAHLALLAALLLLVRPGGSFFSGTLGRLFRGPGARFRAGQTIRLPRLSVEVLAADRAGEPRELLFRFAAPLEDPSLRWIVSYGGAYRPFVPPAPGRRVDLPAPEDPFLRAFEDR